MTTSQVRVAIRLRPLTTKEITSGGSPILTTTPTTVALSDRKFTYDAVYDESTSQSLLYQDVAPPLLDAFLGGYNATVMAYGQTSSGKTYSMGSEAHSTTVEGGEDDGLIPRFMNDIFSSLEHKKREGLLSKDQQQQHLLDYTVEASFLEVYGEDIHDLLEDINGDDEDHRKSLPIREDSSGQVIVVGLRSTKVKTNVEAMEVLNTGTMNRTTASTLMNTNSSRSHAVFVVNLKQVTRSADGTEVVTCSRFTFVDLAGSERMKKTGAEGKRKMEGIQINVGLLALGNVINALADEERLAKGEKPIHVPYRQSKLTRLLQDALGGNSQTLFLACVSPSDTNASETLSTLQYANRARNIKNKPTKNVDATILELENLRALTNVLKCELIKKSFTPENGEKERALGEIDDEVLQRADVLAYMNAIDEKVAQVTGCNAVSSYPVSISAMSRPAGPSSHSTASDRIGRVSTLTSQSTSASISSSNDNKKDNDTLIYDVNLDEDMKILDELLELQHRDQQFSKEQQSGQEQLDSMDSEIVAQEERLSKLRENIRMYHNILVKYEQLMCEVHSLEAEKQALADALEKVQVDPTKGCSKAIKRKLQEVEESLARARSETRKQQQKVRQAEQETQKLKVLERKIQEMKHVKVNMMKKQKEAAAKHKEYTNQKTREINALKRKERASEKTISSLQSESQKVRHNLERSRAQNDKLSEKLKQTETHLMRILTERRNKMSRNVPSNKSKGRVSELQGFEGNDGFASSSTEEVNSLKFLLEKSVGDRVNLLQQLGAYDKKVVEHGKLLQSMASEMKELNKNRASKSDASVKEHEENLHDYQLKLELVEADLERLREKYPNIEEHYFEEDDAKLQTPALKIISKIEAPVLRTLFCTFLESHVHSEHERKNLKDQLARKDSTLRSFEKELEVQYAKVDSLSKSLCQQRRLSSCNEPEIEKLKQSIKATNSKLDACLHEKDILSSELSEARKALDLSKLEHANTMDQLALARAKENLTQSNDETSRMLSELQSVWAEVGLPMNERQAVRDRLKHCVEDACESMLVEASKHRDDKRQEVERLRTRLQDMRNLMGLNGSRTSKIHGDDSLSLDGQMKILNDSINKIRKEYENAFARCKSLLATADSLVSELELDENVMGRNLTILMHDGKSPVHSNQYRNEAILSRAFLDACENDLKKLRLLKSNRMLSVVEMSNGVQSIACDMDVTPKDLVSMAMYSINRRSENPRWLDAATWKQVEDSLSKRASDQVATEAFVNHLSLLLDTIKSITHGRKLLSEKLKQVVEESHEAILATAEGSEMDVMDLYKSLQDTLGSLPPLSKNRCAACIDEMKMFVTAAESICQSEIETLTVLWEGLNVSSGEKGRFWSRIEAETSKIQSQTTSPFDCVINDCNPDIEEWVLKAVTEASKVQRVLGVRVFKLKSIHAEVARLKTKQYAKNRIMSLNGELKLLSAKLADYEEKAGNRHKLTNKKINSSTLLEEERFRKQMQGMFAAKLETMRQMLNEWEAVEGTIDDSDLLSEVTKDLLKNSHRIDAWVNEKIRFMHLRTSKSKVRDTEKGKAPTTSRPSSSRSAPTNTPRTSVPINAPRTAASINTPRTAAPTSKSRLTTKSTQSLADTGKHKIPLSGTSHNTKQKEEPHVKRKSPSIQVPEVSLTNPFGDLLADTPTSKENSSSSRF